MTINVTNTCENCFRPEISDFGSGLHAISLSILWYSVSSRNIPQIEIVLPFSNLFYIIIQSFATSFKHPTTKEQNDKLHKSK